MSIAYDHMKKKKNILAWYNSVDILMKLGAKLQSNEITKKYIT